METTLSHPWRFKRNQKGNAKPKAVVNVTKQVYLLDKPPLSEVAQGHVADHTLVDKMILLKKYCDFSTTFTEAKIRKEISETINNIYSTSTLYIHIQQQCLFNFNTKHSPTIFIQLQDYTCTSSTKYLFNFNTNIHIQHTKYSFNYKASNFIQQIPEFKAYFANGVVETGSLGLVCHYWRPE